MKPETTCRLAGLAIALALAATGCAGPHERGSSDAHSDPALPAALLAALPAPAWVDDVVLLGEVHDNALQHRLRLRWIEALTARRRMAIALEQFDSGRQADLDRFRQAGISGPEDSEPALVAGAAGGDPQSRLSARARALAQAAGFDFHGWNWALYAPVVELALRRDLPLIAANLSRREAASVVRGQVPASPEPAGWGSTERAVIDRSIRAGHCDLLPEAMIEPMAAAQRARDARLAESVAAAHLHTGLPVLLLAGNGHVRRDIGVPRYLAALLPGASVIGIGLLEEGDETSPQVFDRIVRTPAAPREDPCLRLRAQAPAMRNLPAQ